MTFVAGTLLWGGYVLGWVGWLSLTDRVNPGASNTFWWPSILDLVKPGRVAFAVPPKLASANKLDPNAAYAPGAAEAAQGTGGHSLPTGPGIQTPSTGTSSNPTRVA